jgi:N-acyl-D-amino-acid deacylase
MHRTIGLIALAALALASPAWAQTVDQFDLLITNGRILDGSGNPWFGGDVGVRDGRIVAVGKLEGATAARTIDATGRIVSPGFIDIHSHADDTSRGGRGTLRDTDARRRSAPNLVMQGITTVVVNHDGRSVWPIAEQRATMERLGIGPNTMLLVGHGEVRRQAMGDDVQRPATPAEIERMRELVRRGLREGAFGISAGLEYSPGRWSTTDEVVAIVEEIVPYRGVYISHERSEGSDPMWYWPSRDEPGPPTLIDAVSETIEIGERTGAVVVASHIKSKGAHYWGVGAAAIQLIQAARDRGVQVYADQYPYNTSGTDGNAIMIPGWVFAGGGRGGQGQNGPDYATQLRNALGDPATAEAIRRDIAHEIRRRGGPGNVVIFDYPDTTYIGKSLGELAAMRDLSPIDMAITLQYEGYPDRRGGARARGFSMSELDIEMYAAKSWVATATDGGIALPDDGPGTHARFYGTFPRKIRHYAIDRGVLTLEAAVRSATGLPAQILGLKDRGCIREGCAADIVVFDPETIADRATFFEPHQYPAGIDYVTINGQFVVDAGKPTGALPGRIITPESIGRRVTTN